MTYYLGIDPGLSGALAFYSPAGNDLSIFDMPTHEIKVNGKLKRQLDLHSLGSIIDQMAPRLVVALIEDVHAMPKQGVTSSFNFGFNSGCAQMAVVGCNVPLRLVTPQKWKKEMGLSSDKDASRREASRVLPKHANLWPLVKHDGRAEAGLLAYYASRHFAEDPMS